jgi:putative endonuclease
MTPACFAVRLGLSPDIMKRVFHVYILANASKMLYIRVTNDLQRRTYEHKHKLVPGFSAKYNLHRLVYFEAFGHVGDAIMREKQLKGWLRSRKVALIQSQNPKWLDLAADWFRTANQASNATKAPPAKPVSS